MNVYTYIQGRRATIAAHVVPMCQSVTSADFRLLSDKKNEKEKDVLRGKVRGPSSLSVCSRAQTLDIHT